MKHPACRIDWVVDGDPASHRILFECLIPFVSIQITRNIMQAIAGDLLHISAQVPC